MIKKPVVFLSILILLGIVIVVVYRIQTDPFTNAQSSHESNPVQISETVMQIYVENCAVCHGESGQGVSGYPPLQNTQLETEEIKILIQTGQGVMPAFPQIQEPQLSQLAEMVKQLSDQ